MRQIVISFLIMLLPMAAGAEPIKIDGIFYILYDENHTAEVSTNYIDSYSGTIIIPESIK